jgi:predicted SAM-dependent methyltransferase
MIHKIKSIIKQGKIRIHKYEFSWSLRKKSRERKNCKDNRVLLKNKEYKLHIGPGRGWEKPSKEWLTIDIDSERGDFLVDFNRSFKKFPLPNESVSCIYGSHVFEHINIYACPDLFKECYRVLKPGGYFRLVLPDVRRSIEQYLNNETDFPLFKRRKERAKKLYNLDYTIFECLKEDFLSRNGQVDLLGQNTLAHQNAWDFETIKKDLSRVGFDPSNIYRSGFCQTNCQDFRFEGTYPSEANEDYRSLYVECFK